MTKPKTGTREWSQHSVNCCLGCRHACLYCYGRAAALRFGKIERGEQWAGENPHPIDAATRRPTYKGIVMFPTQHDITVGNAGACLTTLVELLKADNRVLVVSKAGQHVPPILGAALDLAGRGRLELRVSLTHVTGRIGSFWEPGAPAFGERLQALEEAHMLGPGTSVSIEPCLEADAIEEILEAAEEASVSGEIWIGAANLLRRRTAWCQGKAGLEEEIRRIEAGQTPEKMAEIFEKFKGHPQVRWKDSYQRVLGIDCHGKKVTG